MTVHRVSWAAWLSLDEAERQWRINLAHQSAIMENFLWELTREIRRIIKPIVDWLEERL